MSKALYEEGLSGMESEYAQYAEAKAVLDACGFSRQTLTEEKRRFMSSLHRSTSRSAQSGRRSSCAKRLRIRQRSCSAMSLHRKNLDMRKNRRKHATTNRRR